MQSRNIYALVSLVTLTSPLTLINHRNWIIAICENDKSH
jgi:hypothetical protein